MAELEQADFEKLGVFYLGREYDLERQSRRDALLLYDSRDLVTHALCVGMTGSGKTGLCLGLLEEAAIDGIPALVIDPKGDLANLLLQFPELRAEDLRPWIQEGDARRAGVTPDEHARAQAELWRNGLAQWGQDGERIARLGRAAEFAVYTPGSNAGIPVSIVSSLGAPPAALREDAELFQERIGSTATSLLGLLGIDADPIQSREHILLATILNHAWRAGTNLDLGALIEAIQKPPVARVGVLELEAFYPAKERFQLAMRLNNLLASPSFASWLEGEPLDLGRALYAPDGKPRVSIFSIAHLSDAERMFFVSLLLNQTLAWMRQQPGTTSLRAVLYMDEIFGYFPPVANPPSKAPLLTLLKQARAYGLGVVLATQNPVDLDYKGLANCGTWFLGRLQTDRDKQRVLDGLEGASAAGGGAFDRASMDRALSALGKRVFLMNNVHDARPVVFETRWTLSYLRGPLTRTEIKALMDPRRASAARASAQTDAGTAANAHAPVSASASSSTATQPSASSAPSTPARTAASNAASSSGAAPGASATPERAATPPVLAPEIAQVALPVRGVAPAGAVLVYQPALLGCARVYYSDAKLGIDMATEPNVLVPLHTGAVAVDWDAADLVELDERELDSAPRAASAFGELPPEAGKVKSYDAWRRALVDYLCRTQRLELQRSPALALVSRPGESERDFTIRMRDAARAVRDEEAEVLRTKYAPKLAALEERVRRAEQTREKEAEQARDSKVSTFLSFGVTLLGAFAGRKTISAANAGRAAGTARSVGRSLKESKDVERAEETVEALRTRLRTLDEEFQADLRELETRLDPAHAPLETVALKPKKTNVSLRLVALAWVPNWRTPDGRDTPARS